MIAARAAAQGLTVLTRYTLDLKVSGVAVLIRIEAGTA